MRPPSARFFNRVATLDAVGYSQDLAGGEVLTPSAAATPVPCCVQQDDGPDPTADAHQDRYASMGRVKVFFRTGDPATAAAVANLKVNDRIAISGPLTLVVDGPAFDASGRGAVWECRCRDVR